MDFISNSAASTAKMLVIIKLLEPLGGSANASTATLYTAGVHSAGSIVNHNDFFLTLR
jgi:hypothetical protein